MIFIKKNHWKAFRYLNFAISFGIAMTTSLLVGYYGGTWLDQKFGTTPFLMVAGVLLGIVIAFYALAKELQILEVLKSYDPNKFKKKE